MKKSLYKLKPIVFACSLAIVGCGGGGDSTNLGTDPGTDPVSTTLSGTAAAGAAIIGTVTVKGTQGNTKSALIEADGTYNVDVTGLTAPYRLRAQGTVGGKTYKLHSYAEAADVDGTVNITPFTDLIIANAAQQIAASYFDDDVLDTTEILDPAVVEAQEEALQVKLQDVFDVLGIDTAIDLLNSTFSADHSGLDAALDLIKIEVDAETNIATITNLVDNYEIMDSVLVTDDNDDTFVVAQEDEGSYTEAVSDTQAIANLFDNFTAEFVGGLPTSSDIEDFLAVNFLQNDNTRGEFLTDITTDPELIDLQFAGISISDLDSAEGTASVTFNVVFDGVIDDESETWFVSYDDTLGWQMLGDQRIVDINTLNFHCNDYDGTDNQPGGCGINVSFWDENFTNNGTGGVAIASGTFSLIDGTDGVTVKDTVYLGTPDDVSAGEVRIYNIPEGQNPDGYYSGDWRAFGSGVNQIDSSIFAAGDIIEYKVYSADLDVSAPAEPMVSGAEAAKYTENLLFEPSLVGLYPTATSVTVSAIQNFTLGENLTIVWTLEEGTVSDEVLVEINDSNGNRTEVWDESFSPATTSITIASTDLDTSELDTEAVSYQLLVRIYAADEITGQFHSTDYRATIDGPAADTGTGGETGGGTGTTTLTCGYESGWDDIADEPSSFNSYTDFQAVVTDCGGSMAMADIDIIGTWKETYSEGNVAFVETSVFNANGSGTFSETEDGVLIETVPFSWTVSNNLLTLTASIGNVTLQDVWALTDTNTFTVYSEQSSWSSSPDLSTLDSTAEGEVWNTTLIKQP